MNNWRIDGLEKEVFETVTSLPEQKGEIFSNTRNSTKDLGDSLRQKPLDIGVKTRRTRAIQNSESNILFNQNELDANGGDDVPMNSVLI